MEGYLDLVRKMVKSMEETASLLKKFQDMRENASEEEFIQTISKLDEKELEDLQNKFNKYENIISNNL